MNFNRTGTQGIFVQGFRHYSIVSILTVSMSRGIRKCGLDSMASQREKKVKSHGLRTKKEQRKYDAITQLLFVPVVHRWPSENDKLRDKSSTDRDPKDLPHSFPVRQIHCWSMIRPFHLSMFRWHPTCLIRPQSESQFCRSKSKLYTSFKTSLIRKNCTTKPFYIEGGEIKLISRVCSKGLIFTVQNLSRQWEKTGRVEIWEFGLRNAG